MTERDLNVRPDTGWDTHVRDDHTARENMDFVLWKCVMNASGMPRDIREDAMKLLCERWAGSPCHGHGALMS